MSLNREQVREALAVFNSWAKTIAKDHPNAHEIEPAPTYALLAAAAQAWVDSEDAVIIRKVDGEWPAQVVHRLGKALYEWTDDEPFHKFGLPKYMVNAEMGEILLILDALSAESRSSDRIGPAAEDDQP
jgi:hypothetical protein